MASPAPFSNDLSKQIEAYLAADPSKKAYAEITKELTTTLSRFGINLGKGVVSSGQAIMDEGLKQAQQYEEKIVAVYGDISTQQSTYGQSAAKMTQDHADTLRQEFLQIEAGGISMVDVFKDADAAQAHAEGIIKNFQGSARQFTDELTGTNLVMTEFLSMAAGLSGEQTSVIMKIAKARGEDNKQMLADIGTFSKTLADKFGLDTKRVAQSVADITADTSTFGKVSIEAATAASAKFESMGVSMKEVAGSIGSTFQSFEGAAGAASKLSQVFGVNIDAMQMMIDVNSGPEGMVNAVDSLRESLIGAGVDASELSPPLRRLIKEMTGIQDDLTIESLFDPDRIGVETDDILEAAKKAAEAQKEPADALKFLDNDIAKVRRSVGDLNKLVEQQMLTRLGLQAKGAAVGFSDLTSKSAKFLDLTSQLLEKSEKLGFGKAFTSTLKAAEGSAIALQPVADALGEKVKAQYKQESGKSLTRPVDVSRETTLRAGRGAFEDKDYRDITGYQGPTQAKVEVESMRKSIETATSVYIDSTSTPDQKAVAAQTFKDTLTSFGVPDADKIVNSLTGQQGTTAAAGTPSPSSTPPGASSPVPTLPATAAPGGQQGATAAAGTPSTTSAPPSSSPAVATTPASSGAAATVTVVSPTAATAAAIRAAPVAAAAAPGAAASTAATAAPGAAPVAKSAVNSAGNVSTPTGATVGTVATTGVLPAGTSLSINVYLDPAKVVAAGGALVTGK